MTDFDIDVHPQAAHINVPDSLRDSSKLIRNPVTDKEHHMLTVLPGGWVFHETENVSSTTKGISDIKIDMALGRDGYQAHRHWRQNGAISSAMSQMATPVAWTVGYSVLMFFMWWIMMMVHCVTNSEGQHCPQC